MILFGKFIRSTGLATLSLLVFCSAAQNTGNGQILLRELSSRNTEKVKELIDQDTTLLEITNPRGSTPLTIAASLGLTDLVIYLTGKGANPFAIHLYGR